MGKSRTSITLRGSALAEFNEAAKSGDAKQAHNALQRAAFGMPPKVRKEALKTGCVYWWVLQDEESKARETFCQRCLVKVISSEVYPLQSNGGIDDFDIFELADLHEASEFYGPIVLPSL